MITRHYFISARKPHDDGNGSYSFAHVSASHKSWLADPPKAYLAMLDMIEEKLKDRPGEKYEIVAFNRI